MVVRQKLTLDKHQFAFFYQDLQHIQQSNGKLVDIDLYHRVVRVVKVAVGETVVLFNQQQHVVVKLVEVNKRYMVVDIISEHVNISLKPHVTFMLPLLKREALEESIYSLAEMGVNEIQLVVMQKSRQKLTDKDIDRLHKIVISAAEQSKHFAFPQIHAPCHLQEYVTAISKDSYKVMFDVSGKNFLEHHREVQNQSIHLTVGPEGSFTQEELQFLKDNDFQSYALTKTVLRSLQAVAVGAALFRL